MPPSDQNKESLLGLAQSGMNSSSLKSYSPTQLFFLMRLSYLQRQRRECVNVLDGKVTYEAVADAHGLDFHHLEDVLPLSPV